MSIVSTTTTATKRKLEPSWFCIYDVYDLPIKDFNAFGQHLAKHQTVFNEKNDGSIKCIDFIWGKFIILAFYNIKASISVNITTPPQYFKVHDVNCVLGIDNDDI